jgi:hypothetical protein
MKRRLLLLAAALLLLGAMLVPWLMLPARQMRERVDQWVHDQSWRSPEFTPFEQQARLAEELRQLGPEAGRMILTDAGRKRGKLREAWERWREKRRKQPPTAPPGFMIDPLQAYRFDAARAMVALGKDLGAPTDDLLALVEQPDINVRLAALELLGVAGVKSPRIIAVLTQHSGGPAMTQTTAAIALCRLQPTNAGALKVANDLLSDPNPTPARDTGFAVGTLVRMGPAARPFAPGLRGLLVAARRSRFGPLNRNLAGDTPDEAAFALCKIEDKVDEAMTCLTNHTTGTLVGLLNLTRDLSASPVVCRTARPWLKRIDPRSDEYQIRARADALRRIERTLGKEEGTAANVQ